VPLLAQYLADHDDRHPRPVLLIKLSRLNDEAQQPTGFILVFFDVTEWVAVPSRGDGATPSAANLRLTQIPTLVDRQVRFVPVPSVTCLESNAHTTRVYTRDGAYSCNLSISDLEDRLDPRQFLRVHRCFIVNLEQVAGLQPRRLAHATHVAG
jgi:DNA-binding LytR/AlgR family response regulator